MTFQNIAVDGTQTYLSYLEGADKGVSITNVISISKEDNAYWLKLESGLGGTDESKVKIYDTVYEANEVKLLIYDKTKKMLKISVSKWLKPQMDKVEPDNICIITDMKFLVKRVLEL